MQEWWKEINLTTKKKKKKKPHGSFLKKWVSLFDEWRYLGMYIYCIIKKIGEFLVYVHACLQSGRTHKAFRKTKHSHLWAFHCLKCPKCPLLFFFRDTKEYLIDTYQVSREKNVGKTRGKKIKNKKSSIFLPCNTLVHKHYQNWGPLAPPHAGPLFRQCPWPIGPYPTLN
jgi:uncharacterized C2H2 Zn-finger protein